MVTTRSLGKRSEFDSEDGEDEDEDRREQRRPASANDRSRRELIENRHVADERSGVCCSPWRTFV